MQKLPNFVLGLLFLGFLSLAVVQGRYVDHLRESDMFYRWVISSANQVRLFGRLIDYTQEEEQQNLQDVPLYDKLVQAIDRASDLPDAEDAAGNTKLERVVSASAAEDSPLDEKLWDMARGSQLAEERQAFLVAFRNKQLASVGTLPGLRDYYNSGTTVSLGNMFFGFRKMAANLLWLQVDSFWHKGMLHRMVPLMQTSVMLDPEFVDAFLLGAWHLAYNATAQMKDTPEPLKVYYPQYQARLGAKERYYYQGIDFLKDGIRKNPRNYKLYFDLGYAIYQVKLNDYANAVKYLSEAIRHKHDKWVPRTLYLALQKNGQYAEAKAGWERYLREVDPNNANAPRFIRTNEALMLERRAEDARKKGDEAQAKALQEQAHAIWSELVETEKDPYALVRLRRMDALDLARQNRHHEAVALLDQARYESPDNFDEISDLMIKIKQEGKLPLYLSEKLYLARKSEADKYIAEELKKLTGKSYELKDEVWYEEGYANQEPQLLTPGSKALNELRGKHPEMNVVLAFKQPLIFQLNGTWYQYRPTATPT